MKRTGKMAIFCCALLSFTILASAATPPPTKPPIQVLEEMTKQLRSVESVLRKEAPSPSPHWQEDLLAMTDPLQQAVNQFTRTGMHTGNPFTAYGLRVLVNNLRSAREPKHALQLTE